MSRRGSQRGTIRAVILRALFKAPRVSVLLPVWNGEAFLEPAIESMLRQTLSSFELIVIDDGSTDASAAMAGKFACGDDRVRVMRRAHEGLSAALNAGIAAARGEYIARMDADDINVPDRLQKQVAYLDAHPACVAVGAWIDVVDEAGLPLGVKTFSERHEQISAALLLGISPIAHPTVVMRRDVLRAAGGLNSRSTKSSATRTPWTLKVVRNLRRFTYPESPAARISRSTRLRPSRSPSSCRSRKIRRAP